MDIPPDGWMPELEMEDLRNLMNQHQRISPYSELGDSFFSQGGTAYTNLDTRNDAILAVINSKYMNEPEIYKATNTDYFTPGGSSSSNKLVMDIPSSTWLPELDMKDPRYFMNQHQHTHQRGELEDSLSSQGFNCYINFVTRNESAQSPIINKDLDKQEFYKATRTNSYTPIGGSSSSNTLVMDNPSSARFPELEMEDPCYFTYQHQHTHPDSELVDSFSSQGFKDYMNLVTRNNANHATTIRNDLEELEISKATRTNSFTPILGASSSNTFTISFGDHNSSTGINQHSPHGGFKLMRDELTQPELSIELPKRVSHVLAEKKRREKLTRHFKSLSAVLPEMKKMDKASVLECASKYIKHLQTRVKGLKETSVTRKNIIQESTTLTTSKFHGGRDDNASSFDDINSLPFSTAYDPGIKVKISGSHTLVRIYCQRNSFLALKAITRMESLHFIITSYNIISIAENAALITIIAQMSEEFKMTAMDLVNYLQTSLSNFL